MQIPKQDLHLFLDDGVVQEGEDFDAQVINLYDLCIVIEVKGQIILEICGLVKLFCILMETFKQFIEDLCYESVYLGLIDVVRPKDID